MAVEGFVYGINSFDQWGVQLGKELAKDVRLALEGKSETAFNEATKQLLGQFMEW